MKKYYTISLANGYASPEASIDGALEGVVDLGPCYGLGGVMNEEEARRVSLFIKMRKKRWNLDDWVDFVKDENWISSTCKYVDKQVAEEGWILGAE